MEKIRTEGRVLLDEYGRERIFNGINVCDKGRYDPETGKRNFEYDWTDGRIEKFVKNGMNIIRLGITWEAVEPEKGKYNEEYLDAIEKILDKCAEAGIYAYIDMHQDLYSGWGNGPGDGAPAWACYTDGYKYTNPKLVWAESYFISKAVHRAFDNFWNDGFGVQTAYRNMWVHVAKKFDGHPALFGYDVMNEPFLGTDGGKTFFSLISSVAETTLKDKDISKVRLIQEALTKGRFIHVLDQFSGDVMKKIVCKAAPLVNKFDTHKYMPFLNATAKEIRKVSKDPILFIENSYYSNMGIKCEVRPITVDGERVENQIFAPHAYDLMVDTPAYKHANSDRVKMIFDQRKREQESNLDMPLIVGEWGGYSEGTEWLHHIEFLLKLFDSNKWSNTYWAYFDGLLESPLGEVLKRPYPRAVTGKIEEYKHDRSANTFTLTYTQDKKFKVPTEIFAHRPIKSVETDGKYTIEKIDDEISVVKIKTAPGRHTVKIKFEGVGFSYLDNMAK